jgi:hypothetical protein
LEHSKLRRVSLDPFAKADGFKCEHPRCYRPAVWRLALDEVFGFACGDHTSEVGNDLRGEWAFRRIADLHETNESPQLADSASSDGSLTGRAKTAEPNPKDLIGETKPPNLSVIPSTGLVHLGLTMKDGADKYGAFNWREHPVRSGIYVDAAIRHIMAWQDGEEKAGDSGRHHLGHAMACMAILLDAQESGNLIDERVPGPAAELIDRYKLTKQS